MWDLMGGLPVSSAFQQALAAAPPKVAMPAPGHGGWRRLVQRMSGR